MAGPSRRAGGMTELGRICLLLLFAGGLSAQAGYAGDLSDASERHYGKVMTVSLRIAQAAGNERKVTKYKSLIRQHRAGKSPPASFSPPGTRVSRPGRPP